MNVSVDTSRKELALGENSPVNGRDVFCLCCRRFSILSALIIVIFYAQSVNALESGDSSEPSHSHFGMMTNDYASDSTKMFYSSLISSLFSQVNRVCKMDLDFTGCRVFNCGHIIDDDTVPVIVCKDGAGVVDHIGFCFLPDSVRLINRSVVQFIERVMLDLMMSRDVGTTLKTVRESGLLIQFDNEPLSQSLMQNRKTTLSMIKGTNGIVLDKVDKKYYMTIDCPDSHQFSFSFPADCKLISGMDKREQEMRLAYQLKNHSVQYCDIPVSSADTNRLQLLDDSTSEECIYVIKGDEFSIPEINNDLFFIENDSIYSLVHDTAMIAMTFSNALLASSDKHFTYDVKHRMYGFMVQNYTIDSRDFDSYFAQDYERYFGIETLEPQNMSGTLILYNRKEEYIHLIHVTTTQNGIINEGRMTMELYSNIPQHNIKSLFSK